MSESWRACFWWPVWCCAVAVPLSGCGGTVESSPDRSLSRPQSPQEVQFDSTFAFVATTAIEGTEEAPVYSFYDFAVTDTSFIVPDRLSHDVKTYDRDGVLTAIWGRQGKGPGEFKDPNWIGIDRDGRVFVREGQDNFRVQIFNASGEVLTSFPLGAFGPFTQSFIEHGDGRPVRFFTVTRVVCGTDQFCAIQVQDESGRIVRRVARENEVEPEAQGLPFVAGRGEDGTLFVAHRLGEAITKYDRTGQKLARFRIDVSPEVVLIDPATLPSNPIERAEATRDRERTMIRSIYPVGDRIVVDQLRLNGAPDESRYFLDIYDPQGNLLYYGITPPASLRAVAGDRFYFVSEDEEAEYGSFQVMEYRLTGS